MKCPICKTDVITNGKVRFNDTKIVTFYKCHSCAYIFCPEMFEWDLGKEVYNENYGIYDPEFKNDKRNVRNSKFVDKLLNKLKFKVRHLDYGGGTGRMSRILRKKGWDSTSYDMYHNNQERPEGKFNFITCIEVIEHAKDPFELMKDLTSFLSDDGMILLTTLLANKDTPINWSYIAPRGGHISILSDLSIRMVANTVNLKYFPMKDDCHVFAFEVEHLHKFGIS
jgi:hypothetical protein